MSLPPTILLVMFEGAPLIMAESVADCRDYLADVFEDAGDSYQVWTVGIDESGSHDSTSTFAQDWADACEFGSGDDPDEFLKPFPGFVLAHVRDGLIATYRKAQSEQGNDVFERSKVRSL